MSKIPLNEAMIIWLPDTELWQSIPSGIPPGSVRVINYKNKVDDDNRYPKSVGACNSFWSELTDEDRRAFIDKLRRDMIDGDKIKPADIDAELSKLT